MKWMDKMNLSGKKWIEVVVVLVLFLVGKDED